MVLGEPFVTLVPHSGMNTVLGFVHTDERGILHCWRGTTEHCALLADIGEVVVAGDIIPAPTLVCHHHHTVLSTREEVVWLILPPVLILQSCVVCPLEVPLHCPIIQTDPRVLMAKTVNELVLLL